MTHAQKSVEKRKRRSMSGMSVSILKNPTGIVPWLLEKNEIGMVVNKLPLDRHFRTNRDSNGIFPVLQLKGNYPPEKE